MATVYSAEFYVPPAPTGTKSVLGQQAEVHWDDGAHSLTVEPLDAARPQPESGMFVRLMSWHQEECSRNAAKYHPQLAQLLGKHVRVTVEVLD